MNALQKTTLLLSEIGPRSLGHYAWYAAGRKLGRFSSTRLKSSPHYQKSFDVGALSFAELLSFHQSPQFTVTPIGSVDEILQQRFRPFGGPAAALEFALPLPLLLDWTNYSDTVNGQDIKWLWEPARFCWLLPLLHTFTVRQEKKYPQFFWERFAEFNTANPAYLGPNWVSAQEVALRALNWLMAYPILTANTTPAQMRELVRSLWQHLLRLPPTIAYAKSQNNNHLLSEALGLYLLGAFFAGQSSWAAKWETRGQALFEKTLLAQIAPDGMYCQHSSNYHRMMLHLALLYDAYQRHNNRKIPPQVRERLAQATRWLQERCDPISGQAANLGHNDGTLLLPFGCQEYADYRPTLQAASLAFCGEAALPAGPWDELAQVLNLPTGNMPKKEFPFYTGTQRSGSATLWGSLRAVHFNGRPGHADQLHVDLWWQGQNIARDAGTYAYNAAPPWQNALMATRVHNTVTIDGHNQMLRAGKFLWLKQAQATLLSQPGSAVLTARQNGYRSLGILHTRSLEAPYTQAVLVTDRVDFVKQHTSHQITLHWLLPDWEWRWQGENLHLAQGKRHISLRITAKQAQDNITVAPQQLSLIRAGVSLLGEAADEIRGWVSPTYGIKTPALSLALSWQTDTSLLINSAWQLQEEK